MTLDVDFQIIPNLKGVLPSDWDRCADGGGVGAYNDGEETFNPFIRHAFLMALEESGCVGGSSGWRPIHLLMREKSGALIGAAPSYLKTHSLGEYVFDQGWAQAYEDAGGRYYPKLQICSPFTPVAGARLLIAKNAPASALENLVSGVKALTQQSQASSAHITFCCEEEARVAQANGFMPRLGVQFHFLNEGYRDFEDFLSALSSRKRKAIRKERTAAQKDLEIKWITGADVQEKHWHAFFEFYIDTGARKWGQPYLNRRFFSLLGEALADRILLVFAMRDKQPIAGALNFIGDKALYGRYWGAIEDIPYLHFELCYYQAIDFALARGLKRVEAGAQGEHKLMRGYRAVATHSAHFIVDPQLGRAVADFLILEREHVGQALALYADQTPFRKF